MTDPASQGGEAFGQLPSPEHAEIWEQVYPGSIARFFAMAEAQTIRRLEFDERSDRADRTLAERSLRMAFCLSLLLIIAAIVFFAVGNNVAGGLLLGVPAMGVAVAFIPKAFADR